MPWVLPALFAAAAARPLSQALVNRRRRLRGPRTISELTHPIIGGIPQAVQIRGQDVTNPILLWLHGGPGFPMMPFAHAVQSAWEHHYTIVHWDQRNSGKTLARNGVGAGSLDRHVEDGLELSQQLRQRFPGVPIILVGHSWGTAIAVEMLRRAPDHFAAYLAIGQVSDFIAAERYGYERVSQEAQQLGARRIVKRLQRISAYPFGNTLTPDAVSQVRSAYIQLRFMHHRTRFVMARLLWLAFQSPDYSWRELATLLNRRAGEASMSMALQELPTIYERARGAQIDCPVIMVAGARDLFTPTPVARQFFDTLEAPDKEFVEMENLAHVGPFEDAAFFDTLLIERLKPSLRDEEPTQPCL